jgi:hypothetical protein
MATPASPKITNATAVAIAEAPTFAMLFPIRIVIRK